MASETAAGEGRRQSKPADAPLTEEIQRLGGRLGLSGTAVAVLMVVFGVLVIVFPELIAWLVGGYLIAAGAIHLAGHVAAEAAPGE